MRVDMTSEQQQAVELLIEQQFNGDAIAAAWQLKGYLVERLTNRVTPVAAKAVARERGPVLLSVRGLTKTYKRGRQRIPVLHGVDLDIHEGEIVAITGASGSGKSTLLQLMGGLDKPTSGEVVYGGKNLAKLSDGKLSEFRRQTVGFVFQFFYLQPFLRLERNLEVPGMFARTKRKVRLD
ncbi:MAG: ABC transporter ATP-binding protein, partial [Candidatus Microsaccharimonas sp.]